MKLTLTLTLTLILITLLLTGCEARPGYYGEFRTAGRQILPNSMDCDAYCESYGCSFSPRERFSKTGTCKVYGPGLLDRRKSWQY